MVGEVTKDGKYKDKKFGLIAYGAVADPPSFDLHEQVVPFLTKDRMTWIDDDVSELGKRLNVEWSKKASTIGWYDYSYGSLYAVPRMYMHQMADNYRFGADNGVKYIFSEVLPTWGEGPKYWIMAKLEWDPYQDVDALMDQWCVAAVGEEAAPYLRQYYDYWEEFWTNDILDST